LPIESSHGSLMEQLSRHLQERGVLSGGSIGPLDRRRQRLSRARARYRRRQRLSRAWARDRRRQRFSRAWHRRHSRRFTRVLDGGLDRLNWFDGVTGRGHWFILRWQEPEKLVGEFEVNPLASPLYPDLGNCQLSRFHRRQELSPRNLAGAAGRTIAPGVRSTTDCSLSLLTTSSTLARCAWFSAVKIRHTIGGKRNSSATPMCKRACTRN